MMDTIFNFLYGIFGFLFRIFFDFVGNYGIALVLFTLFFRIVLLPSTIKQQKASAKTVRLQPKLKRIREKYQDYNPQERQQKIQQETSELYQREGTSPMGGGCLPLLIQLPILWGLYGIIRNPLTYVLDISAEVVETLTNVAKDMGILADKASQYAESVIISNFDKIVNSGNAALEGIDQSIIDKIAGFDFRIFGLDLGLIPGNVYKESGITAATILVLAIPVLAGLSSLLTSLVSHIRQKKANPNMDNQQMMGCMMLSMPLMSVWIAWGFPVGMGLYWILSSVIAFVQTLILGHIFAPRKTIARLMVEETIYRRSYEETKKIASAKSAESEEE